MIKEPKIIFHHIPKCGGTSIVSGLALAYYPLRLLTKGKKGFTARLDAPTSTKKANEEGINRYQLRRNLLRYHIDNKTCPFISGHYPFSPDDFEKHKTEWLSVTLLRDPLQRWYSEYFWNRYKNHDYRKTDLSIEEYLENTEGIENTRSFVNFFCVTDNVSDAVTEQEKEEAIKNISKIPVIGFLDNLPDFQNQLKSHLGHKPYFFKRNKSPADKDKKQIPDKNSDFEKKLLNYLEADIEIYNKIRENKGLQGKSCP